MLLIRNRPRAVHESAGARRARAVFAVALHRARCLPSAKARRAALAALLRALRRLRGCPRRLLREVTELLDAESYRRPGE